MKLAERSCLFMHRTARCCVRSEAARCWTAFWDRRCCHQGSAVPYASITDVFSIWLRPASASFDDRSSPTAHKSTWVMTPALSARAPYDSTGSAFVINRCCQCQYKLIARTRSQCRSYIASLSAPTLFNSSSTAYLSPLSPGVGHGVRYYA